MYLNPQGVLTHSQGHWLNNRSVAPSVPQVPNDHMGYNGIPASPNMAHMADGGGVHDLEEVHMTPGEVHQLGQLQGGLDLTPHGVPNFTKLGHSLNHPDIHGHLSAISEHRRMAARGGSIHEPSAAQEQHVAHDGVMGDTQVVLMPKHLTHILDHMIGGEDRNPHDGKKQYWLGSLMSGIGNIAQNFMGGNGASGGLTGVRGENSPGVPVPNNGGFMENAGGLLKSLMPIAQQGLGNIARSGLQGALTSMADPNFRFNRESMVNMGRSALGNMSQQGSQEMGNIMQAMPQSDPNSFMGMAGRSLGQMGQAGLRGASQAMQDPNFNWRNGGIQNMARGAWAAARDNGFDQLENAMGGKQLAGEDGGRYVPGAAGGYGGHGGGQFAQAFGNAGRNLGSHYGGQAGRNVGQYANQGMQNMVAGMGGDENQGSHMGQQANQIASRYGQQGGGMFGQRAGQMLGSLMDRGMGYLNQGGMQSQGNSNYGNYGAVAPRGMGYGMEAPRRPVMNQITSSRHPAPRSARREPEYDYNPGYYS